VGRAGIDNIRAKSVRQTSRMLELAGERGWKINSPLDPGQRGGSVVINVPNGKAVAAELIRRKFMVDFRPGAGVRMAPHFYTTDEECESVIAQMAEIIDKRAYASKPSSSSPTI